MTTLYERFLSREIPPTHTHYNFFVELKNCNRILEKCNLNIQYKYESRFELWKIENDEATKLPFKSLREMESYLMGVNHMSTILYSQNLLNALGA